MRPGSCHHLAALLTIAARSNAQQLGEPCEWHIPQGDAQNVWDNSGLLPGETELPCAGSLAYYEDTYDNIRDMCDAEFCPDCEYAHLCDLMCGFTLPADEDLYEARMGKGACSDLIVSGQATCDGSFCPNCGDFAGYCDATCGYCTAVHEVHPSSVCVPEFFIAWDAWNSAGCAPTDGQAHCEDECQRLLSRIIAIAETECEGHDLALLPIHTTNPSSEQHVGNWLHGVVLSDELCNPTACSTLMLEADEKCIYGTGDDAFEFGCDTAGCIQARQNLETHRFNCTGDRDELLYHGNDFATYTLWLEHECLLCHPGTVLDACSQESNNPDSPCHTECQQEVIDFVENTLEDCREIMLGVGYEHSSIQTIEHIYSLCSGASCVINVPDDAFLALDHVDFPCEHTGVLHPGERCQVQCNEGFDTEGDGIAECLGDGQVQLDLVCHEIDCSQPVHFPAHVSSGDCDVSSLVGGSSGEFTLSLERGSSCQPVCEDGYVSNGERIACETHPDHYGGFLEHNFACHLPCDTGSVTAPTNGRLGEVCNGIGGTIGYGEFCDLACDEGFELSNQPECQGHGDLTHLSSTTAICTAINPTAAVASSMTFHMSISNAEEPGFEQHFKSLLSAEYNEFVGPTSTSEIQVTAIELIGIDAVRANYTVMVHCTPGCDGGSSCRGADCIPATSDSVDLRTIPANCFSSRCPLTVGPFPTVDPTLIEPVATIQVQVTLEASIDDINADRPAFEFNFKTSVATILGIARSLIVIIAIDPGSVIVSFTVANAQNSVAITGTLEANTVAGYGVLSVTSDAPTPTPGSQSPASSQPVANQLVCTNDSELCQSWADSGQCEINSGYMEEACSLWCNSDCETQRPVVPPAVIPGTATTVSDETTAPVESEGGGGGGIILAVMMIVLVGAVVGGVAIFKLGQGSTATNRSSVADIDAPPWDEDVPKGFTDKDGHIQEDEHEDNPLADFDVEGAAGDNEEASVDT